MKNYNKICEIIDRETKYIEDDVVILMLNDLKPTISGINKLFKKDITDEQYNSIINKIVEIEYEYFVKKYPYQFYSNNEIHTKLSCSIENYYDITTAIVIKDDSFKLYPNKLSMRKKESLYTTELKDIVEAHVKGEKTVEEIINIQIDTYKMLLRSLKESLLIKDMQPYYGDYDFLLGRIKFVISLASNISSEYNYDEILSFVEKWENKHKKKEEDKRSPFDDDLYISSFEDYDELEKVYLKVVEIENSLAPVVAQTWQNTLTNPNNHDDKKFKYIVHAFTGGSVPPSDITKVCCSLATTSIITIPYAKWGIICDFTEESVDTICCSDAGSFVKDKEDFIMNGLNRNWQLPNPNGKSVLYENYNVSKLLPLDVVETKAIQNNIELNGEILNYNNFLAYSEIYLKNPVKVSGVFYTDECTDLSEVKAYAKEYNLPLVNISLARQRSFYGFKDNQSNETLDDEVSKKK